MELDIVKHSEYLGFLAAVCSSPKDDTLRLIFADWLDDHSQPERASFIRVQCEIAEGPRVYREGWENDSKIEAEKKRMEALRRRERKLLHNHSLKWLEGVPFQCIAFKGEGPIPSVACGLASSQSLDSEFYFKRGFVYKVRCTYSDWARHANSITARCPIERVTLATMPAVMEMYRLAAKHGFGGSPGNRIDRWLEIIAAEWPRIVFTLPAEAPV